MRYFLLGLLIYGAVALDSKPKTGGAGGMIKEYCNKYEKDETRVDKCEKAFYTAFDMCKKKKDASAQKQCMESIWKKLKNGKAKPINDGKPKNTAKKDEYTKKLIMASCKKLSKDKDSFKKCVMGYKQALDKCKKYKNKDAVKKCMMPIYAKLKGKTSGGDDDRKSKIGDQIGVYCKKEMPKDFEKCAELWKKSFAACKKKGDKDVTELCVKKLEMKLFFKKDDYHKEDHHHDGKPCPVEVWCKKNEPKSFDECKAQWKKAFEACKRKKDKAEVEKCEAILKKKLGLERTNKEGLPAPKKDAPAYDTWTPGSGHAGYKGHPENHHGEHGEHGSHGWTSSVDNSVHLHGTHGEHGEHGEFSNEYGLHKDLHKDMYHKDHPKHA